MTSTGQNTDAAARNADKYELQKEIRIMDINFRDAIKLRIQEISAEMGNDALDALLNPQKVSLADSIRCRKARAEAMGEALERYNYSLRHLVDPDGVACAIVMVCHAIESMRDSRLEDTKAMAVKAVTGTPEEITEGKNHLLALVSHSRVEGANDFIKMLKDAFGPEMRDAGQAKPIRRRGA